MEDLYDQIKNRDMPENERETLLLIYNLQMMETFLDAQYTA